MPRYQDWKTGKFISKEKAKERGISPIDRDLSLEERYIFERDKIIKKKCSKCKEFKLIKCFHKGGTNLDKRKGTCKDCRRLEKKSPQSKERDRIRMKKLRIEVLIHYGGNPPKCACCGESYTEFLCIDHIGGGGLKHLKSIGCPKGGINFYRWLRKNDYPEGFRILCYNCNRSLGNYGYCPHKKP